ncbi:helix-turn-helix domain-containing protein [Streptomyces sp900105245]|uniref:Helix-turn-helix domain-containing protein n=1 Tax=Streptomyces sp. 900105245 TaxID=3154379 RepID=A0ABV1UM47_9ACTN
MVELSRSGQLVPATADELRCSPKTVRCWLHRFNRFALDGGLEAWAGMAASGGSPKRNAQESLACSGSFRRVN